MWASKEEELSGELKQCIAHGNTTQAARTVRRIPEATINAARAHSRELVPTRNKGHQSTSSQRGAADNRHKEPDSVEDAPAGSTSTARGIVRVRSTAVAVPEARAGSAALDLETASGPEPPALGTASLAAGSQRPLTCTAATQAGPVAPSTTATAVKTAVAAADAMAVAAVSSPAASQSVRSVSSTRFDPNSRAGRDGSADGNGERGGRAGGHGEGNDGNFGLQLGCERGTVAAAAAAPALNGLTPGNEPDSKQAAPGVFTMPHPTASPTAAVAMAAAAAVAVRSLSLPGAAPTCPVMAPPLPLRRRRPPWGLLKKWPGRICMDLDFDWNFVLGLRLGRGSCPGKLPGPQKGDTSAAAAAETLDSLDTTSTLAPCCVHHSAAPALPFPTAITTTATSVAQATTGLMETLDVRVMERLLRASRCSGGGRGSESGFDDCNSTLGERTAFAGGSGVGGRRQRQCLVWRQRSAASQARRRDCQKGYHCIGGDDEGEGEGVAAWAQANGLWTVLPARPGLGCSSTLLSGLVPFPPVCEGLLGAQDPVIPSGLSDGLAVGEMFPYNFQPIAFMPHSGVLNGGGITDHARCVHAVATAAAAARYSGGFVNTGGVSGGLHGGSPICTECTLGTDGATSPPLHPLPLPQRHRAVHLGYHPQPETGPPGSNQEAAAAAAQRLVQALCPVRCSFPALPSFPSLQAPGPVPQPQLRGGRDTAGPPPTGGHSGSRSGAVSSIWGFGGTLGVYGNMGFVQSLDNPLLEVTASAVRAQGLPGAARSYGVSDDGQTVPTRPNRYTGGTAAPTGIMESNGRGCGKGLVGRLLCGCLG